MIIGNNTPNNNFKSSSFNNQLREGNNFNTRMNSIKENNSLRNNNNIFTRDIKDMQYTDPTSKSQMQDKSLALLHERLNNGDISLEEFNKKISNLTKNR